MTTDASNPILFAGDPPIRPAKEMVRLLTYPGKDPDYIATLADSAFVRGSCVS